MDKTEDPGSSGQRGRRISTALMVIFSLVLLSGCWRQSMDYRIDEATYGVEPTATESLFGAVEGLECVPNPENYQRAELVRVIDGDSIAVIVDGEQTQVRYIGINTPEYDSPQREAAIAATAENERLLASGELYLFKDISNTDKYDRLLRYVVAKGKFVNLELVRSGHAESKWYRPDVSCQIVFDQAASKS